MEKCPAVDGVRYYRKENNIRICMESCQQRNEADAVYVFADCSEDECECKTMCGEAYVLPNGTCAQECGVGFVSVGKKCTDKCPESQRYKLYVTEGRTECRDTCDGYFMEMETG